MICLDNSDYMRNEDFYPSRMHAQKNAASYICYSKRRSNPENDVGLVTLTDVKVVVALTDNIGSPRRTGSSR